MSSWRTRDPLEDQIYRVLDDISSNYRRLPDRDLDKFYHCLEQNGEYRRLRKLAEDVDYTRRDGVYRDIDRVFLNVSSIRYPDLCRLIRQLGDYYQDNIDQQILSVISQTDNPMYNYYKSILTRVFRKSCSMKMIFYTREKGDFKFLLGRDAKYLEWTPLGGTCSGEQRGKSCCDLYTRGDWHQCLKREMTEESREIISEPPDNCPHLDYIIPYGRDNYHSSIHFASSEDLDYVISEFKSRDTEKYREELISRGLDPKHYFEMSSLSLFTLVEFVELLDASLHYYWNGFKVGFSDTRFAREADRVLSGIEYGKTNENSERLDPFFLVGLASALSPVRSTRELAEKIAEWIDKQSKCELKKESKTEFQ